MILRILPPMFKPVLQQIRSRCKVFFFGGGGGGGKMYNFAIQLILQQCCKTSCTRFVVHFTKVNSLVLCCASPSGHIIAASKGAVIFTGCLKRGNYGPFSSPNAFIAILIILPG